MFVAHNASFDLGFLRAALARDERADYRPTVVDTAALARRLLRDDVPNCRLSTLADRLRLDHKPTHRALDDALATTDLLHLLIERATGLGVLGLDDLVTLAKLAGHPQAAKLTMTAKLPRTPGVYMFCGYRDEVLYVGKATNLRQRVRSYFGRDDRRRIGPMLREMQAVRHLELADPLIAEVDRVAADRAHAPPLQPRRHPRRQVLLRAARHRLGVAPPGGRQGASAAPVSTSGRCRRGPWPTSWSRRSSRRCRSGAARPGWRRRYVAAARRGTVQRRPDWASPSARAPGRPTPAAYTAAVDTAGAGDDRRPAAVADRADRDG